MKFRTSIRLIASLFSALALTGAHAEEFHGFDPNNVQAEAPGTAALQAMVAEAIAVTPPRNGDHYVFGYTMWGGNSPFSLLNKAGLEELGEAAGIEIVTADNEWDPNKNVANIETFATRNVDFVINSLLDVQFASAVRAPLDEIGISLVALDIPVPGSQWMGVDNARAGFRAGTYLAQSAISRWGNAADDATLVILSFPLVGPNGKLRNLAQLAGVSSVLEILDDRIIWLETDATPEGGFAQMNNILSRLDPTKPLLIASFSDEVLSGALRSVKIDGLDDMTIAVGMGGTLLDQVATDPTFLASMSFFPKGYANAAIPIAMATLAGHELPTSIFAYSDLVTPAKTCQIDPETSCGEMPEWMANDADINEAAYSDFVAALHNDPYFKGYEMLLPPAE